MQFDSDSSDTDSTIHEDYLDQELDEDIPVHLVWLQPDNLWAFLLISQLPLPLQFLQEDSPFLLTFFWN